MFVHLNLHSEYSIQDSILRINQMVDHAVKDGQAALGIADLNNMFGVVKFYKSCLQAGIKPIIGMTVEIEGEGTVCLLAQNNEGYANLLKLSTCIWHKPQGSCTRAQVNDHSSGLLAVIGDGYILLDSENTDKIEEALEWWSKTFEGCLYFSVKRTGQRKDDIFLRRCIYWGVDYKVPIIAINEVRFANKEDFFAHEVRVCISRSRVLADKTRDFGYCEEQWLKPQSQMKALFSDIPQVIENTARLATRCNVTIELGEAYLPNYPIPAGETIDEFFSRISHEGLQRRLIKIFPLESRGDDYPDIEAEYIARLEDEMRIISEMGFIGYFLIVMDFIGWAKANDIPVGIGRGSGAGSLVAYCLLITDLDPIGYKLLFERFLNPERVSMPDFDIDFCIEGRDKVIDYVKDTYGHEAVSQIITFGRLGAKAVIRDVCRVMSRSFRVGDKLAKLIPMTPNISIAESIELEPQLAEILNNRANPDHEDATDIIETALKIEGIVKSVGRHAGGVLIAPKKITDFSPIYYDEEGHPVSQYDKDDVENAGLVKFDFLGLRNLTVIKKAVKLIHEYHNPEFDIDSIPLDDDKTFELLKAGKTTAVFQLESDGMKKYLKALQPSNIEDVIAMCALYRPGPLDAGMVEMYIERKHGREQVDYPHPLLEEVLQDTNGVIIYQEQVMKISQVLAGYSLGGADLLRRAMGKKKPEEMHKQRIIFMEGAVGLGIDSNIAAHVFDLMETFAGYGFNRSHSAAYGMLAYQTAYLKAHYPTAFMSAVMSSEINNSDKLTALIEDCKNMGISIRPPDINTSGTYFKPASKPNIIEYALSAIKGVGEQAAYHITERRKFEGFYESVYDFCKSTDYKMIGKRVVERLIDSGAMDEINTRHYNYGNYIQALQYGRSVEDDANNGFVDLFSNTDEVMYEEVANFPKISHTELAEKEFKALGYHLKYHPIDAYIQRYGAVTSPMIQVAEAMAESKWNDPMMFMGVVLDLFFYNGKAIFKISDTTLQVQVSMDDWAFRHYAAIVKVGSMVFINGTLNLFNDKYYAYAEFVLNTEGMDEYIADLKQHA